MAGDGAQRRLVVLAATDHDLELNALTWSDRGSIGVQDRVAGLTRAIVEVLGVAVQDTDHQGSGDCQNVVLPASV